MTEFGLYEWVYGISGIFGTYTLYMYMKVFFNIKKTNFSVELLSYAAYYIIITLAYLLINIPIVLISLNLLTFFCLTLNYESTFKKRILATVLTYLILMIVELISIVIFGSLNFYLLLKNEYFSIYSIIVCRILSFLVVLVLNNFKNIRSGESVPTSYLICIAVVPISSLYMNLLLFQANGLSALQVFAGIALLFFINFSTFYLYDVITAVQAEKMQGLLLMEQNKYYNRQLEIMETSLQTTRTIRHDLKNHMFSLKTLMDNGDIEGTLSYISKIMKDIGTGKDYSASGNTVIDSIINFKFQEAEQRKIKTNLDLKIPDKLDMPSFDITVILGNLLDNAIKAAAKVEKEPYISLKMRYDKGRLMIQMDNPYAGEINDNNGELITTESDRENHGFGLQSIKKVIQKYDGTMNIDYKSNIFSISLLIYI